MNTLNSLSNKSALKQNPFGTSPLLGSPTMPVSVSMSYANRKRPAVRRAFWRCSVVHLPNSSRAPLQIFKWPRWRR